MTLSVRYVLNLSFDAGAFKGCVHFSECLADCESLRSRQCGVPPILFRDTINFLVFMGADVDQYAIGFSKTP